LKMSVRLKTQSKRLPNGSQNIVVTKIKESA